MNSRSPIALIIVSLFISYNGYSQKKVILAGKYILPTHKNSKKFTVKNRSSAKIGIIFSHNTSDTIYLRPKESKDFKYKKCPITSNISPYLSEQTWKLVLNELIKTYEQKARAYGIRNDINDAWIKFQKAGANDSYNSRSEQKKRERGNRLVKKGQEGILQSILDDLQYYKDLYDVSYHLNDKRMLPISMKTYLGGHYQRR